MLDDTAWSISRATCYIQNPRQCGSRSFSRFPSPVMSHRFCVRMGKTSFSSTSNGYSPSQLNVTSVLGSRQVDTRRQPRSPFPNQDVFISNPSRTPPVLQKTFLLELAWDAIFAAEKGPGTIFWHSVATDSVAGIRQTESRWRPQF